MKPNRLCQPAKAFVMGLTGLLLAACGGSSSHHDEVSDSASKAPPPNVVLVVMDDVGIDQWTLFGYGGLAPPAMPNIDRIAQSGVAFRNLWSMPACSNGRAALFTGRYPLRTNVMTAIGSQDLANYMVNPNEMTLPRLLKSRGYQSALFGKFHLGIQANNPYGLGMVHALGFDYYQGWLDETGDPSSIDTTAGGVAPKGTWSCGFVADAKHAGADSGACYSANQGCQLITKTGPEAPGRRCRDQGGIFDPNQICQSTPPAYIDFDIYNGHSVSPLTINQADGTVVDLPATDPRARTYRTTGVVNAALDWLQTQPQDQPWMVTLSFATDHTPLMQPPSDLLPEGAADSSHLDCDNVLHQQFLSNQMEEAMDKEIGRFLVEAGLATRGDQGELRYDPAASNTYVIVVSDNGSLGTVVKVPFDKSRAKSTAYQTGVWNPGIVAGPGVFQPGRAETAMVNIVDIYQLIAELAGVENLHDMVPRPLDSESMQPYLAQPGHAPIRTRNYTEVGYNRHANDQLNGPCVFDITTTTCSQITPSAGVCHDNGGTWWGPDPDWSNPNHSNYDPDVPAEGFSQCCALADWQANHDYVPVTEMFPTLAYAMRNRDYKLVVNHYQAYDPSAADGCAVTTSTEFYQVNEQVPNPKLDEEGSDLLASGQPLTKQQQDNYDALSQDLTALRQSAPNCPEDINLDGVVDQQDVAEWVKFEALSEGASSWADIDQDGVTDQADKARIEHALGSCPTT